jgi:hypothetical protein
MTPRDITTKRAVKNVGEACAKCNYDTKGSDNFCINLINKPIY